MKHLLMIIFMAGIADSLFSQTNTFPTTGNAGVGTVSPGASLDVLGSLHAALNSQSIPASFATGGLFLSWNRSSGGAEVNLWNVYSGAGTSFQFSQKTGTSTYADLMTLMASGNLGLSTTSPASKLDIQTSTANDGVNLRYSTTGFARLMANSLTAGSYSNLVQAGDAGLIYGGATAGTGTFGFVLAPWSGAATGLRMDNTGNVGIATANTQGYQLAVNGSAIFTKAVVKLYSSWPDYVFEKNYKIPSLHNLENYLTAEKHLPGLPSAKDIQTNGIDLGENQAALLKKVEELTLYVIELNKKIEKLSQHKKMPAVAKSTKKIS